MNLLNQISGGLSILGGKKGNNDKELVPVTPTEKALLSAIKAGGKQKLNYIPKAVSQTRQDIKTWKEAVSLTMMEEPKNYPLQDIYTRVMDDSLLTSQIENRQTQLFGIDWNLRKPNGDIDEEQTTKLKDSTVWRELTKAILDIHYVEYNLIELDLVKNIDGEEYLTCSIIPRTHVVPQLGRFYFDYTDESKFIDYRTSKEFGVWWLEFNSNKRGIVNKAVKHFMMKDFTQSCWAELGEIYGIPPRFMKTDTQDPAMLTRAENMMKDMGAAAWFIIDETEEFEFAKGVSTNGEVYKNLINLCNNEMSMLITGAIIGQDTVNGNRSKDESAKDVLWSLVLQDMITSQDHWNKTILPALKKIGFLKGDVKFRYDIPEDLEQLWKRVVAALPHYEIDPEWVAKKFGIAILGKKEVKGTNLSLGESFFL